MRGVLYSLCVILFLWSCSDRNAILLDGTDMIYLGTADDDLTMTDLVEPIRFVTVEATDSCLLKHVTKVIDGRDGFYLFDPAGPIPLSKYSKDGKFLMHIGSKGMGPEEYAMIQDVSLNKSKGEIYVVGIPSELLIYDLNGIFKKRIQISDKIALVGVASSGDKLIMTNNFITPNVNQIYSFSSEFEQIGEWDHNEMGFVSPICDFLKTYDTDIYYLDWYNNQIYEYNSSTDEMKILYNLDLENSAKSQDIDDLMDFMMMQNNFSAIYNWGINNSNLLLFYSIKGTPYVKAINRIDNRTVYHGRYFSYIPEAFLSYSQNEFISVITVDNYGFFKQFLPSDCGLPEFDEENTNVILMYWKLKK